MYNLFIQRDPQRLLQKKSDLRFHYFFISENVFLHKV